MTAHEERGGDGWPLQESLVGPGPPTRGLAVAGGERAVGAPEPGNEDPGRGSSHTVAWWEPGDRGRKDNNMDTKGDTGMKMRKLWGMIAAIGLSTAILTTTGCGTVTGAAVGAAGGAAVGAATGYGAGKGALIGTGVGAAAGAIYDVTR